MEEKNPSWLKAMQNGTLGEVRTKAFLMDRFWILERSVDIEGADFIIQRKLQGRSILSEIPPRFGVVQAKFSQDENTSHKVKREYVLDPDGQPHMEFFLIINIGHEDSQKICLMSAKDIFDKCDLDSSNQFIVITRNLVKEFEVKNRKSRLDFMEHSIRCAEFYKNRIFVFNRLKRLTPDLEAIDPFFTYNIEYNDGNVPDIFKEQKQRAYEFIEQIEDIHHQLVSFIQEIDPIKSCFIAEHFNHQYLSNHQIRIPDIFDSEFYFKTIRYREQIHNLQKDGILYHFLSLRFKIKDNVNSFLENNIGKVKEDSILIISIEYNTVTLEDLVISNEISSDLNPENKYFKFKEIKEGSFKVVIAIGIHLNQALTPFLNEACLNDIIHKIYSLKYFEDPNEA